VAGHSKWSKIKRQKAVTDKARGKLFAKLGREIAVAAREGGGDLNFNPRLRTAVDNARSQSMPNENIERAIKRGTGDLPGVSFEEVTYEGYGPGGVAILCETLTDNKNRTVAEVRHGFSKFGGSLGTNGSVAYLFEKTGVVNFVAGNDEELIMEAALEAGAHDVVINDDDSIDVLTTLEKFGAVQDRFKDSGLQPGRAEMTMLASAEVDLDLDGALTLLKLVEHLEDLDDVQNVYSNANISDEIIAQI